MTTTQNRMAVFQRDIVFDVSKNLFLNSLHQKQTFMYAIMRFLIVYLGLGAEQTPQQLL